MNNINKDVDTVNEVDDFSDFKSVLSPEILKTPKEVISDIIEAREENKIYVSEFNKKNGKYISMYIKDSDPINIQISPKIQISLSYINQNSKISGIEITKIKKGAENSSFTLSIDGFDKFIQILDFLKSVDYSSIQNQAVSFSDINIGADEETKNKIKTMFMDPNNQDFLKELVSNSAEKLNIFKNLLIQEDITKNIIDVLSSGAVNTQDIVNMGYRRKQLTIFEDMLSQEHTEKVWQDFFEKNKWIFGYGLDYKFNTILQRECSTGSQDLTAKGDLRPDFMLKNAEFTVLVELKTPQTPLLGNEKYCNGCWGISNELADSTSQVLAQKHEMMLSFERLTEDIEEIRFYDAKAILVIGTSKQFNALDNKEKRIKKRTFELYRRNLRNVDIITYDELYERAKFIAQHDNNTQN